MRVVSLLPSATDIVAELGLLDQLVGVSDDCNWPTEIAALPLVAAGGIVDASAVRAVLAAGAVAAQAGTAFLLSPEAGTSDAHRRAIAHGKETAVTRAFSGRRARAIVNDFMRAHTTAPSAFPQVLFMTAPLRRSDDPERRSFYAGVNFARTEELPAAEIVARDVRLVAEEPGRGFQQPLFQRVRRIMRAAVEFADN